MAFNRYQHRRGDFRGRGNNFYRPYNRPIGGRREPIAVRSFIFVLFIIPSLEQYHDEEYIYYDRK